MYEFKILVVFLNLLYGIDGDTDEVLILTSDWTTHLPVTTKQTEKLQISKLINNIKVKIREGNLGSTMLDAATIKEGLIRPNKNDLTQTKKKSNNKKNNTTESNVIEKNSEESVSTELNESANTGDTKTSTSNTSRVTNKTLNTNKNGVYNSSVPVASDPMIAGSPKLNPYDDNLWNKNVSPQADCGGVALDRNFNVAWNTSLNVSSCSQIYPGPAPFSEAESTAIKDVFLQYGNRMAAYIHVHATDNNFDYRGHTVLYPKGHADTDTDEDKYIDLDGEIDEAMKAAKFDIVYVNVESLYSWYGPVSGTSVDYASEVIGVPFAMEFLIQPYERKIKDVKKDLNHASLTQIWRRVIDVVFNFIYKTNNPDESD